VSLALAARAEQDSLPPLKDGKVPQTLDELWGGYDPTKEPLEVEVLKEWEEDGVTCRLIRYQVGVFKGAPAKVAAFYAFPKGGAKLPAVLQMHGGGQSAGLDGVVADAKNGYAGMSLNWGGNRLNFGRSKMTYEGPQTDWGKLDATHPPQRNKANHFAGALTPDEFTLDAVESPRNSNWFLVLIAARRALTFLEQQPEVDPARIGATGHSMGGKLTTDLAGIDKRVKAAVPSCGGAGNILESQATELPGCVTSKSSELEMACVADNAYIPRIACPILWLSPVNDFHGTINNMAWNWRNVPESLVRFSMAPHLNHVHTPAHSITRSLWFEQHLKGSFTMPATPRLELNLKTATGVPLVSMTPADVAAAKQVEVYYSIGLNNKTRFWRSAKVVRRGDVWEAVCPVMSLDEPLFVYANVSYDTPEKYRNLAQSPGNGNSDVYTLSSRMLTATPAQLQAAGVKATDKPDRMIDDGTRGWQDWFQSNWGHPPLWRASTRKLTDPKWRGPDGGKLLFEIRCEADNALVVTFNCNGWGAIQPGKPTVDYVAVKELKGSPDWQTVSITAEELVALDLKIKDPLANWRTVTEFSICPSGEIVKDGQKVKAGGKAWKGPREIRNMRWEGGKYVSQRPADSRLSDEEYQKQFNDSINKSLEQEKLEQKVK
jgi:hypothetical protein